MPNTLIRYEKEERGGFNMYDNRTIPNFEVDVIIKEELNQTQLKHISRILELLAEYMLLDSETLFYVYQKRYREKLGLSYLKKSVKEKLLIEYKYNYEDETEQDVYFYCLKDSAFYALDKANIQYAKLPYFASYEEKSRLLTFNKFVIDAGESLDTEFSQPRNLAFFKTKSGKICYFSEVVSLENVKECIQKNSKTKKKKDEEAELDPADLFEFVEVNIESVDFGKKTKAVNPKDT